MAKELPSQSVWFSFTYRPLSAIGIGPHRQKRKLQTEKAVQPQEVNHSLYCVCQWVLVCDFSHSLVLTSLSFLLGCVLQIHLTSQCTAGIGGSITTHSESSPLPFVECIRVSPKCRGCLPGNHKMQRIKRVRGQKPALSLCLCDSGLIPCSFCKYPNNDNSWHTCMTIHVIRRPLNALALSCKFRNFSRSCLMTLLIMFLIKIMICWKLHDFPFHRLLVFSQF